MLKPIQIQEDEAAACALWKSRTIVYKMRGVSAIKYHLVTQQHVGNIITTMSSYALPVSFFVRIDFSNIYLLKVVVVSVVVDLQAVRQMKET